MGSTTTAETDAGKLLDSDPEKGNPVKGSLEQGSLSAANSAAALALPSRALQLQHLKLSPARIGDHPSIHHLLLNVFHQPSEAEFHAQNEEPLYEPTDRLLVKRDAQIVAHVRIAKRQIHLGPLLLPMATLSELATLPEFRGQGIASALLQQAESQMIQEGSVIGALRTPQPHFYLRRGWVVCGKHCYSTAGARDILSHMSSVESERPRLLDAEVKRLNIRLWRHVERAALSRLYDENSREANGAMIRSDQYWSWLINRRAYERIYVAIDGPQKLCLDDSMSSIVGYAVEKEGRIVEIVTSPRYPLAPEQMLSRICGDAIERDYHTVRIDAPCNNSLHKIFQSAGGTFLHHEIDNGHVLMVKLFDPMAMLERLLPHLKQRAQVAGLSLPVELGLLLDRQKFSLEIRSRSAKIIANRLPRKHLILGKKEFTQMLLGHLDIPAAIDAGKMKASTPAAAELATALFPQQPIWRPPLDDLAV